VLSSSLKMKKVCLPLLENTLVSRRTLAERWACSDETVKRRERAGLLTPIRFSLRLIRYRLAEVLALEVRGIAKRGGVGLEQEIQAKLSGGTEPDPSAEGLISREALAERLECSVRTLQRYETEGLLTPVRMDPKSANLIGYRMGQVYVLEKTAGQAQVR
jgi:hypothetical protein